MCTVQEVSVVLLDKMESLASGLASTVLKEGRTGGQLKGPVTQEEHPHMPTAADS